MLISELIHLLSEFPLDTEVRLEVTMSDLNNVPATGVDWVVASHEEIYVLIHDYEEADAS